MGTMMLLMQMLTLHFPKDVYLNWNGVLTKQRTKLDPAMTIIIRTQLFSSLVVALLTVPDKQSCQCSRAKASLLRRLKSRVGGTSTTYATRTSPSSSHERESVFALRWKLLCARFRLMLSLELHSQAMLHMAAHMQAMHYMISSCAFV